MTKLTRTFTAGRMNKVVDERLVPNGEYIDAMNVRMGSTEQSEIGVIENTKGNLPLTSLMFGLTPLSNDARCIGAIEDSARETIYWFVHDPNFFTSPTNKLDMIVSFNTLTNVLTYHVISINDGLTGNTTLNFNPQYLITGVDIIENLLFFTDDYNQPRFINIKRNYPSPVGLVDQFSAESILVIKKPPVESPSVSPFQTIGEENYMDTRFISFAYRYRYADGEYSATSQWSEISFVPGPFNFTPDSYLNEGMENTCNSAIITYNSGGPLVVGIDLLFKQADNNIIKVIEKLDKSNLGLVDNTDYTYSFSNSKIFTVLPESELLRLYDNVPRLAKAQTIMGNRLMYGNYVEGYDLIDKDGFPLKLEYYTDLISEPIGIESVYSYITSSDYYIDGFQTITNSFLGIDLGTIPLVQGSSLNISFKFKHNSFSGTGPYPTATTPSTNILFSIYLQNTYPDVYSLVTSTEFQDVIGTALNIKPVYSPIPGADTSCDGFKLTDRVNCLIPTNLDTLTKYESGITAVNQPLLIVPPSMVSPTSFGLQIIAMKFVDNVVTPTQNVYEYYEFESATVSFQKVSTPKSLHSNRGYEIGIVYMDEYNRATTALVSPNNTEYVPCSYSPNQNSIQVTIPPSQIAPAWAKRYKFVCKADLSGYDTIYSSFSFKNTINSDTYFLLEGENTRKVNVGDTLIVKTDTNGIVNDCVNVVVLEKEAKQAGFLGFTTAPQGVYMKIAASNFSASLPANSIIDPGNYSTNTGTSGSSLVTYPMNIPDPSTPGMYIDYNIPLGSVIKLSFSVSRNGVDSNVGAGCPKRKYILEKTYVSSADYPNMFAWFIGDTIASTLSTGTQDNDPLEPNWSIYFNQAYSGGQPSGFSTSISACTEIQFAFERVISNNQLILKTEGGCSCYPAPFSDPSTSTTNLQVTVYRRGLYPIIFETVPTETLPDVFYENHLSFEIDSNGYHQGNVQSQNAFQPAIVNTGFFNCFTFGNGAESYKINDSIVGNTFDLGQRVTSVSAQDYKASNRFADITYSGVYNPESNLNKLNEFNLGLLNYKYLEISFGEIMVLDGRETDVLVLQEDKVSYVLAGKNLLSDAAAGGAITSVPEVLGTQIARTEKYGISFNPESYVQWGYDRYFTDAKRGAVIQLKGNSYSNEELKVVSEQGMRTWFRDMFNASFNTQKLGGFDPYMNEYVLSTNEIELPTTPECINCGSTITLTLNYNGESKINFFNYCVNLGQIVGQVDISWEVISIDPDAEFIVNATYNSNTYTSYVVNSSGSFDFVKDQIIPEIVDMTIEYSGNVVLSITVSCPDPEELKIIEVVVTNNYEAGQTIHTEYRYVNGAYTSPLQSNLVVFASGTSNPLVSRYNVATGSAGLGAFPPQGSTMTLRANKIFPDSFSFDPLNDKFKYHRTSTLYNNVPVDIQSLLSVATTATPITGGPNTYQASFTVPPSVDGNIIYLIWDFRDSVPLQLCYDETSQGNVCCECNTCFTDCITYTLSNPYPSTQQAIINFPEGDCRDEFPVPIQVTVDVDEEKEVCINFSGIVGNYQVLQGSPIIIATNCGCDCHDTCWEWRVYSVVGSAVVKYMDCSRGLITETVVEGDELYLCAQIYTTPVIIAGSGLLENTNACGCGL